MYYVRRHRWYAGLVVGLVVGLIVGSLWPNTPLHATATDRVDNFAIATGFVDDEIEAVYFLDFLTGTLRVAVVSNQTQTFQARYETNINADLASVVAYLNGGGEGGRKRGSGSSAGPTQLQLPQTPNYLMVTGMADIRRGAAAREQPGRSMVYVAESNTGILLAYAIPWSKELHSSNRPHFGKLILWAGDQFSTAIKRPEP
ncbi:MAG: hypothetical protein HUU20_27525 [Pirellulales bacterium]|nr:hypothetical protein [Pirellulales bacterium]